MEYISNDYDDLDDDILDSSLDKDYIDVWHSAFEIVECSFKGEYIKENLKDCLELIWVFTCAKEIDVFKHDLTTKQITYYAGYPNNKNNIKNYFSSGHLKDRYDEIEIKTKENSYFVFINNSNIVDEEYKRKYYEVLKRALKIVFEKIELQEKIVKATYYDILTNVGNRQYYNEYLKKTYEQGDVLITFALVDLFRLKYINDQYGHMYGDEYIKEAADCLKDELDENEKIFRIGGDEFAIICLGEYKDSIIEKINRANEHLCKKTFDLDIPFPLHINYGVVEDNKNFGSIYQQADYLMSENKTESYSNLGIERRK